MTVKYTMASGLLKEKIVIVAEHDDASAKHITSALKDQGFLDVRQADSGGKTYEILKAFYEQPEKVGLIVINENLPDCPLLAMQQSLADSADAAAIPLIILCAADSDRLVSHDVQAVNDNGFTHCMVSPIDRHELLLAVNFLLKLRQERLAHRSQQAQLIHDLSEERLNDAKLKYLVAHDELTGLLNRSNFERQLKLALNRSQKLQKDAAVLFIEVDRFCLINEWKGFDVGDRLLVELAALMRRLAPANSLFARVGVNEFCLFVPDMSSQQVQRYAENFKTTVENKHFCFDDGKHSVTISLGLSTLDDGMPTEHPGRMVLYARQACHFGKLGGQNKIGVYNAQALAFKERQTDIHWAPIIETALRESRLFLVFQPVVELANGAISHYEVMVRMRVDDQIILPNLFIPVAERTGLIEAIDLWVIENTIDFLAALPSHRAYVSVAIKLSASAYQYPSLIALIQDKLELTWVDASRLIFEVAEAAVTGNFDGTLCMVNKIRALGCKSALRNISAGFYTADCMKTFPVDYVKIDDQFIRHLACDGAEQLFLKSMVDRVAQLGKKTIFVYVESSSTVLKLREVGVTLAQGYTLGKPECNLLDGPSIPFAHYLDERTRVEKALHEKESYLRVLIDNIPFLVWLKDTQSRFLAVNRKLAQQLGLDAPEAIVGKTDADFFQMEKARQYQMDDREVLASGRTKTLEEGGVDPAGRQRWTEIFLAPVTSSSGEPLGTLGFARDITGRKNVEADLRIAATAFESQEGMIVTDADTVILKINHSFTRITGYTAEEAIGRKMNLLKSDVQNAAFYKQMWQQINDTGNWQGEIWNRRKDGDIYPEWLSITAVKADDGGVTHYVGTMIDITARKAIEEQMRHIAHHDVLTDLPNRILLADRLQQALAQARRENGKLALMYIDLDKFKPVNDNFGHDVGDLLLKEVAQRLLACMKRESDTVSRLGGDEFVVLLANFEKDADVAAVADNILNALSEPFLIGQHRLNISSSIGIAAYPAHGADASSLMKNADNAMYQAKHAGRSCFKFYVYEQEY